MKTCDKCGQTTEAGRQVLVRAVGKATVYDQKPQLWCGRCRAVYQGKWKYHK